MLDVTPFIQSKSDQLNADDLIGGPITVRIKEARQGNAEQPVILVLDGPHQPWKPCKTTLRVLVAAWGRDAHQWNGRSVTLFRDDTVKWAGKAIGGVRISAMSHIDRPLTLNLATARGKKSAQRVAVLKDTAPTERPTASLDAVLKEHNLSADLLDAWLNSKQRPPASGADDEGRARLAVWLSANPERIAEVAAFTPATDANEGGSEW